MMSKRALFILGLATLMLAACGVTRQDLGLGRNSPDEFAVVNRPPLSMPPDYTLHPPRPGAPRPQDVTTAQQASKTLFDSENAAAAGGQSQVEKDLLKAAGANKALPDIRALVDRETAQKAVASPHLVQRLLDWHSGEKPGVTVNAAAEEARIKKARAAKEPLNEGATPIIERQKSGWLGL